MAFDQTKMVLMASPQNWVGAVWYDYPTTDTMATVLAVGYFNDFSGYIYANDKIIVRSVSDWALVRVESNTGGVVTLDTQLITPLSSPVAVDEGGTGDVTLTAHGVLLGEGTTPIVATAAMTDGQLLIGQTAADPLPMTISGDLVVTPAGVFTIQPTVVTYAKIQNVSATSRFLGRISAGPGSTEELTGTQATTLLDNFTSLLKGLAPLSGGGSTNFLRADATWNVPPGTTPYADTTLFIANRGGSNQVGLTPSNYNKVNNNNEVVDKGGWYDSVTNFRYTPQSSGYYVFIASAAASQGTTGETSQINIYFNGSLFSFGFYLPSPTGAATGAYQVICFLAMNGTTDYVESFMYLPATVSVISGTVGVTFFAGWKLAAL